MTGVPPDVWEMMQVKLQNSYFLDFPQSLMVSMGLPFPFPFSLPEADFFTLTHVGALIPPSISTPTSPLNQQSGVPGVTLGLPSMVPIASLGMSAPSSMSFFLGPNPFPSPTSDLCKTPSLSGNLSSPGSKS